MFPLWYGRSFEGLFKLKALKKDKANSENNFAAVSGNSCENCEVLALSDIVVDKQCVLDSGCTFRTCPNKNWFENLSDVRNEKVYMGDNNVCDVAVIGSVKLALSDGRNVTLIMVRYVQCLRMNPISLGTLHDIRYFYAACDGVLDVRKNDQVVLSGTNVH